MSRLLHKERGFALLMTLLIISVVLSVALTTLSLATKQTRLATDTRDAELAFHAANAGLECMRYWRRNSASDFNLGSAPNISCFGATEVSPTEDENLTSETTGGGGNAYLYEYEIGWGGATADRCSQMRVVVLRSNPGASDELELSQMDTYIPGYSLNSTSNTKKCEPGGICTVFSSRGYSADCASIDGAGVLQRDILLEF